MQTDSQAEAIEDGDGSAPPRGWLNRNVVGMGLTSLLSDAGHEMATAVMAGFLAVLGAPVYALGQSRHQVLGLGSGLAA
jgi:hypothetical protein